MQKVKKTLIILLLLLSTAITTGCKTTPSTDPVLPPEPQRQHQEVPQTTKDYAHLLQYYENLVQEWELWAQTVKNIIGEKGNGNP